MEQTRTVFGESVLHVYRVPLLVNVMALLCGLHEHRAEEVAVCSAMHDIGKKRVPQEILNKSGKLTPDEFEVVKQHAKHGAEMLRETVGPEHPLAPEVALLHHERWNGEGYPYGLRRYDIPLEAQIVGAADCYDALCSRRSYKPPIPPEDARQMILAGKCGSFSPLVLRCFESATGVGQISALVTDKDANARSYALIDTIRSFSIQLPEQ